MTCHISFRDIDFSPSETGVRIRVYTDVPCHLYCRLTTEKPEIHKIPVFRRGIFIQDDIRICFVVYEDNDQYEAGDTLIHTWYKTNWDVCVTKYMYFWGSINGEVCVSTSPIFDYHNTGESPVPVPRVLDRYTSLEPQYVNVTASNVWQTIDISHLVDENATGVIIQFVNDYTLEVNIGLRKSSLSALSYPSRMRRSACCWGFVGLTTSKTFDLYSGRHYSVRPYIMGYTNNKWVFFDEAIALPWSHSIMEQQWDFSGDYPDMTLALLDIGVKAHDLPRMGFFTDGCTTWTFGETYHCFAAIPPSDAGKVGFYVDPWPPGVPYLRLVGYTTMDIFKHVDPPIIGLGIGTSWQIKGMKSLSTNPVLCGIKYDSTLFNLDAGVQKGYSRITESPDFAKEVWMTPHPNPAGQGNFMRTNGVQNYRLCWEMETAL